MPISGGIFFDEVYKIRIRLDDWKRAKIRDQNYAESDEIPGGLKWKNMPFKMANFSNFQRSWTNKILKKKVLLTANKLRFWK